MKVSIADIPDNKSFSDYSKDTEFVLQENFPRYILEPFEIILHDDPRYESALTREEVNKLMGKTDD